MKHLKTFKESMEVDETGNLSYPEYLAARPEDDENDAFDKGQEAKHNDCFIEENPYDQEDPLWDAWRDGFMND